MDEIIQNQAKINETITYLITYFQKYALVIAEYSKKIPYTKSILNYIYNVVKDNPLRVLLEVCLIIFLIVYIRKDRYKVSNELRNQLTEKEIEELIEEWEPEELVPDINDEVRELELNSVPTVKGIVGPKTVLADGTIVSNLASYNFLGIINDKRLLEKAIAGVNKYGVGTCGPPGFYGTLDVHMDLEKKLAKFYGTPDALIYAQGFSTISSVIPAFLKRGDLLICDELCNFAIQKGAQISRSNVKFFKHNDMNDLEEVLKSIRANDKKKGAKITRRFIVTEAIFYNTGELCDLQKIIELKYKYKYRLILDESLSFGVLGKTGRGITEHLGIPVDKIEIIVGSMANTMGAAGGYCVSNAEIVEHQVLNGLAYCFSASLPAPLTLASIGALDIIDSKEGIKYIKQLQENNKAFREIIKPGKNDKYEVIKGFKSEDSPIVHLTLKNTVMPRLEQEKLLQKVVDKAIEEGVLISRAKFVLAQEKNIPDSSIVVNITAGLSKDEIEKAAVIIKDSFRKVLKN
ncbi:PLP-dependent transferase [Neocallimastix lanati (nom. inval.)]|jgi:serine palmitoyltransferase|nr:PLP-dependent transferase [Neocallimastix sp. JGI-2020a]